MFLVWATVSLAGLVWLLGILVNNWTIQPRRKSACLYILEHTRSSILRIWFVVEVLDHTLSVKTLEGLDTN